MIKIDVEGFDMQALKGLERCLANGLIELIQFEYNWRWLLNNNSLRNVFELIDGKPYHFAKLIDGGLQIFDTWHFELDKFFESNYVIIRKDSPIVKLAQHYYFTAANVPRSR